MATGRIGVTPTLGTRWSKAPAGGTTSLSGLDDNSVSLVYSVGYEQVYRNGVLLSRGNDYTATTGNSITLIDATIAGDIIEVFANELVPLTDAISKGQFTAKGALLSATAASTPGVLAVGTNGQVLTADSTESTGLKWATASSSKTFSLLNSGGTALTGATTITVSSIGGYDDYYIFVDDASTASANSAIGVRLNADATGYDQFGASWAYETTYSAANFAQYSNTGNTQFIFALTSDSNAVVAGGVQIRGANNTGPKIAIAIGGQSNGSSNGGRNYITMGQVDAGGAAVTSISLFSSSGNFDAGTMYIYGAV